MKRYCSKVGLIKASMIAGFIVGCNQAPVRNQSPRMTSVPTVSTIAMQPTTAASVAATPIAEKVAVPVAEATPPTTPEQSPMQAVSTSFARGPQKEERKSFVDTTAQPSFAHAPDYTWLVGEVQYSSISKGWRLRYASVEEDDTYGGSVTLTAESHVDGLKEGMIVRVQGQLEQPIERGIAPLYRAMAHQVVRQPMEPSPVISLTGATAP